MAASWAQTKAASSDDVMVVVTVDLLGLLPVASTDSTKAVHWVASTGARLVARWD